MKQKFLNLALLTTSLFFVTCQKTTDTPNSEPILTTSAVSSVTATTATCGGSITSDGGAAITAYGVCWATTTGPTTANSKTTDGTGNAIWRVQLTKLTPNTTYYIRAYATNSVGTVYGNELNFTTTDGFPKLTTTAVTAITATNATSGGTITPNGCYDVTARGICWAATAGPTTNNSKTTDGSGTGSFTSELAELTPNSTYYVRAYATNSVGTVYGNEVSFTTLTTNTVTDYDENVYNTITIGTQVWMVENLKTTHYRDGTAIPLVTDDGTWFGLTAPGYCWYGNDIANKDRYGALYNWYTVNTDNLAPLGWHIATDAEWQTLVDYLGGEAIAGGKMKATTLWNWPNTGATNSSGFTALPGGYRGYNGRFGGVGVGGSWWSGAELDGKCWYRTMTNDSSTAPHRDSYYKSDGSSVRCLRD
ncbi:MAG: FISUMP domain-containing protein [Salinivirgaceae bacterium]